jgi:hypothetical protein
LSLGSGVSGACLQRLTRHTSACFRSRAPGPVSGRLYEEHPAGGPVQTLPLSRCLSAAGIRFLGVLFPPGNQAFLTVGLPAVPRRHPPDPDGVSTFRAHEMRPGWVSSLPRGRRCSLRPSGRPRPPSAASQRLAPATPALPTDPGCHDDEASTRIQGHSPFRPSPRLWHPVGTGALGLFPELRTQPLPATHVRAGTGLEHKPEVTSSAPRRTSNRRTCS